ncbi:hypothetical protein [Sorangium sp. So ce1024]|uniref:hypothetical protein n=1 Tax=unclassified Sorangium TaxID=2621164 RepID=UPI003F0AAECD
MGPALEIEGGVLPRDASLASALCRAVALEDEVAARIVHEAIGRLLGLPVAPEG